MFLFKFVAFNFHLKLSDLSDFIDNFCLSSIKMRLFSIIAF
uniref:Uncharacterized protein n=1 Tax=Ascaris lumbricoides TaxID=6252 RepID=A0A0M3HLQ4_ASCLU